MVDTREVVTLENLARGEGPIPANARIFIIANDINPVTGLLEFYLAPFSHIDALVGADNIVNLTSVPVYAEQTAPFIRVTSGNTTTYYARNNGTNSYDVLETGGSLTAEEIVTLLSNLPNADKLEFTAIQGTLPASRIDGLPPDGGFMTAQAVITAMTNVANSEKATLDIIRTDGDITYTQTNSISNTAQFRYNISMSLAFPAIPDVANQNRTITVPIAAVIRGLDGWTITSTATHRTYTVNNLTANAEVEYITVTVEQA